MNIFDYAIGEMLHLANTAGRSHRNIYQVKDIVLKARGHQIATDVQHIRKECYSCSGTGKQVAVVNSFGVPWKTSVNKCPRCNNGVYTEYWVLLDVFVVGDRLFHRPAGTCYSVDQVIQRTGGGYSKVYEGLIRHEPPAWNLGYEAYFWLALFFSPRRFFNDLGHVFLSGPQVTPMLALNLVARVIKSIYLKFRYDEIPF